MTRILTLTLNPSIDKTVLVARSIPGEEMRVRAVRSVDGGKGVNVARALKALGVSAVSLTLKDLVPSVDARVNTTMVDTAGRSTRLLEPGPRLPLKEWARVEKAVLARMRGVDLLALCGSLPPGAPADLYARLIVAARRRKIPVALDSSGAPLGRAIAFKPWCVKPNREEAENFLKFPVRSVQAIRKALQMLSGYGMTMVLLSLGDDGLAGFNGRDMFLARSEQRQGLTVGCGDASLAGFLAASVKGRLFQEALMFAAAAGSANVGVNVPGDISRAKVLSIFQKIKIERL